MRKTVVLALALSCVFGATALAVPWYKVGDLGYTASPTVQLDWKRFPVNTIAVDGAGNIYASCNNKDKTLAGGVTIFNSAGAKLTDVNLNSATYPAGITKMVKGGDGAIYALQNWREIGWNYNNGINRVIRIASNGAVTQIAAGTSATDAQQFSGLTVNPTTGVVFWTKTGNGDKYNYLMKYDPANPVIGGVSCHPGVNYGWSDGDDRMLNLEYTGGGWMSVINSAQAKWTQDPISATVGRVVGNASDPGWGRNWVTGTAYDSKYQALWTIARGQTQTGAGAQEALVLTRWNGISQTTGLAASNNVWHMFPAADLTTDGNQGAWASALAVDNNGDAWMGVTWGGNFNQTLGGMRDHAWRYQGGGGIGAAIDEGVVQAGSDVMALANLNGIMYATVLNRSTGVYSLYAAPEPATLGLLLLGIPAVFRRRVR